jgi:hypothetical protein
MNPLLKKGLPQLRFRNREEAVGILRNQAEAFGRAEMEGSTRATLIVSIEIASRCLHLGQKSIPEVTL